LKPDDHAAKRHAQVAAHNFQITNSINRAGIVWDEEAVYKDLGGPPNNWSRQETFFNIIRKIDKNEVDGGSWDPNVRPVHANALLEMHSGR
jgi:hypothetical protein